MSELRQDIITGEWVIFASNRRGKPYDFVRKSVPRQKDKACPFCPGNEELTPEVIYQNGRNGEWDIRVFPNLYPAVHPENYQKDDDNFYISAMGEGFHDVLVDTPNHDEIIHDFSKEHIINIIWILKRRFDFMKRRASVKYVQVFKNCGPEAGASINHSHWQIMGIPIVPEEQQDAIHSGKAYFEKKKKCIFCDIVEHEIKNGDRIIEENERFIAFVPYAAKLSYEVWIMPKRHISTFSNVDAKDMVFFSDILKHTLTRVKQIFDGICYNICFQDMPKDEENQPYSHWYVRVLPRMAQHENSELEDEEYSLAHDPILYAPYNY